MKRKTIRANQVVDIANDVIANCKQNCNKDFRLGVAYLLISILQRTNNYDGFRYLPEDEVPYGELPGIKRLENGNVEFPDHSRVAFYKKGD